MATLLNSVVTNAPANIDERIKNKVTILANAPISVKIAQITGVSLWAIAEQLEIDLMLDKITAVNCFFTSDGEISLKSEPDHLGYIMRVIIYSMNKWVDLPNFINPDYPIFIIIIEELAHHFWNIEDEVEVNYKVLEIMKHIFPEIKMEDVYSTTFMDNPTY